MKNNLSKAIGLLNEKQYTCVLCKDDSVYTSNARGINPILNLLDSGRDLRGFSAADKIVGKAAAFIYLKLNIKAVYAEVISRDALQILLQHGLYTEYNTLTEKIINRSGNGICPMEDAVKDITDAETAIKAIRQRLKEITG